MNTKKLFLVALFCYFYQFVNAQATLQGKITADGKGVDYAVVALVGTKFGVTTDSVGQFKMAEIPAGNYKLQIAAIGFEKLEKQITLKENDKLYLNFDLTDLQNGALDEVVVTGTLKEVMRSESPVSVEVYTPIFFKKNPTPTIFDALQNVNGVRPQLNCNICNTGDIHINGLEGPYTMVLIDGMPIVSGLSTVYGLSGIPNSLIERVEIVKGAASSLYGSEAVGGLINIITKKPQNAPLLAADIMATSWQEYNIDLGLKLNVGKKASVLTGVNYFNYSNPIDKNGDNFTDVTLQDRISFFQKWNFQRKNNRLFSLAGRYLYEDRWGGEMQWRKEFRGGDSVYGESIYTKRVELIGNYQLPTTEKLLLSFSYNHHDQDSYYGNTPYLAKQQIAFSQLTWDKKLGTHDLLLGTALRYTFYDDNTTATANSDTLNPANQPQRMWLPGIFIQDEIKLNLNHKLLLGLRYDYNSYHGSIFTPRIAHKWDIDDKNTIRLNAGTGFRVVNLFTEDHAALTGARTVEIRNELKPEQSYNFNLNYVRRFRVKENTFIGLDASAFYTYFSNRIVPNYDEDPNKIIYDNLSGFSESKGMSVNIDAELNSRFKLLAGATYIDVSVVENGVREQQMLTERFSGTWAISYKLTKLHLSIDYTGNFYSPMRLPVLGEQDPRRDKSPWWTIQNIQLVYSQFKDVEIYGGVKNILNWTPNRGNPFLIARANDPFDKNIQFDNNGNVIPTPNNPYGLTFDPTYMYAPNQGARVFLGVRLTVQ